MKLNGVEKIPSGLVTCQIDGREVRILELSNEGFVIRTAEDLACISQVQVNFFQFQDSRYEEIQLDTFEVLEGQKEAFYYIYTIMTSQREYQSQAAATIQDYTEYIMLKLYGDDAYCSMQKVGYPAELEELEEEFSSSFEQQKAEWFGGIKEVDNESLWQKEFEFAICMDNHAKYQQYLKVGLDQFTRQLLEENYLSQHPLANKRVSRIYLGNQFCHNLFPSKSILMQLLEKASAEGVNITIATTYLREEHISQQKELLDCLYEWCRQTQRKVELIINDWGMAELLKDKTDWITLTLGILLNKRRKDPRYSYKQGFDLYTDQLAKNSLNDEMYRTFLTESFGIQRFEYESCGYRLNLPTMHNSLHFPYYQTNTSQYCTLYAKCANSDRGKQVLVRECPYYCEELIFSYPKHLKMVGRYNSLFGMDDSILTDGSKLKYYLEHGMDRLVLTLL